MKNTTIQFAMPIEASEFLSRHEYRARKTSSSREIYELVNFESCYVAVSGVGKVSAATCSTEVLCTLSVDRIFSVGISGAIGDGVALGDLVVGTSALEHDFDLRPLVGDKGRGLGGGAGELQAAPRELDMIRDAVLKHLPTWSDTTMSSFGRLPRVHEGLLASGDQLVVSDSGKQTILEHFPRVCCVDMESAAIARACRSFGKDWSALRVISDASDDSFDPKLMIDFCTVQGGSILSDIITSLLVAGE